MTDSTQRFTSRAGDYSQYRPSYPSALFDQLEGRAWNRDSLVADIGAGTGLFTRLIAERVTAVWAIEPNQAMRERGQGDCASIKNIHWHDGTGELTKLDSRSIDTVVCAQAFHWLDAARARTEWQRILRPGGHAVLVWNERDEEGSALHREYSELLKRWCPEYPRFDHRNVTDAVLQDFFSPNRAQVVTAPFDQRFDLEGWKGRLRSASYCPLPTQPGHREMMDGLAVLFDRYREADGLMTFPYRTRAWWGPLNP